MCDRGLGKDVLDTTSEVWFIKENTDKLECIKV